MSIPTNRWKSTNIYGNLNNYPLYTDATSTTLIESAGIHTDGVFSCNSTVMSSTLGDSIIYNTAVSNYVTDYALYIFGGGDLNVNGKDSLYLKISDTIYASLSASTFLIDPAVTLVSNVMQSLSFQPTNSTANNLNSIGGSETSVLSSPITLTTATTYTASSFFTSSYQFGSTYNSYGTYLCLVNFDIGSSISGSDTTTLTSIIANLTYKDGSGTPLAVFKQVDTNTHLNKGTTIQITGIFNIFADGFIDFDFTPIFTKTGTGYLYVSDLTTSIIITRIG